MKVLSHDITKGQTPESLLPLNQLQRQMALKMASRPSRNSPSTSGPTANVNDVDSIYLFDLVSTNGRLLDRLDNYEPVSDPRDQQGALYVSSLVPSLQPNPLLKLLPAATQIRRNISINYPQTSLDPAVPQRHPNRTPSNLFPLPSRQQPQLHHNSHNSQNPINSHLHHPLVPVSSNSRLQPANEEYNIKLVSGNSVQNLQANDTQLIVSFQADMTSLESVATINLRILVSTGDDSDDDSLTGTGTITVRALNMYTAAPRTPQKRPRSTSLPDPTIDMTPKIGVEEDEATDEEWTFNNLDSTIPHSSSVEPKLPVGSFNNSFNNSFDRSRGSKEYKYIGGGRDKPLPKNPFQEYLPQLILSELLQRRVVLEPPVSSSPSKFSKERQRETQMLLPEARTQYAIDLRLKGDHREALYQLQLAANPPNNYPQAMYLYALALKYGKGVKLNERNLARWILRCLLIHQNAAPGYAEKLSEAKVEDLVSLLKLALAQEPVVDPWMLFEQIGKWQPQQITKVVNLIKLQQNVPALAFHELGVATINGVAFEEKNESLGIKLLERASSLGNFHLMAFLGELYCTKTKFHRKDYHRAAIWYKLLELFGEKSHGNSWIYKDKYAKRPAK